jgi:ElaB/YqjD/DUF883 family membrane-anchored ribosome-binding protein
MNGEEGLSGLTDKTTKAKDALKKLKDAAKDAAQTIVDNLEDSLQRAESALDDAKNKFNEFKNAISGTITGAISFTTAIEEGDFMENLRKQAAGATAFADKIKQLIQMGLNEAAIQQVLNAGVEAGSLIADSIIQGGSGIVNEINTLMESVKVVADSVGELGAVEFYQAGIDQGEALVAGIRAALERARAELIALQNSLAAGSSGGGSSGSGGGAGGRSSGTGLGMQDFAQLAEGGLVTRPTFALIGEAGPEMVVPLSSPNAPKMGTTINITVNAGIGTNGAQVGREIVDAIKKFEKTSGPVFASA